jgi:FlaA1/EpsC-like NDP-sugar epimerase
MGATKRASEKLIQVLADRKKTRFVSVRFGNVLGSAGSVIPIFKKQIDQGGPVTVTHPDMIRFFMTIPEAAQLIIQAWALGENGQVFVLDMGEPVKILDLAEQMIRLHGFEPGREIAIQFTGLRPGEKLFEELLTDREKVLSTRHDKIFVAREEEVFDRSAYEKEIDQVIAVAHDGAEDQVLHHLRALVPTYRPSAKAPS